MSFEDNPEYFKSYTFYTETINGNQASIKINPVVSRGNTNWQIRIFKKTSSNESFPQQGPSWFGEELTDEILRNQGIILQDDKIDEINEARQWAEDFLEFSTDFNRKKREEAPLSELSKMTGIRRLWESYEIG